MIQDPAEARERVESFPTSRASSSRPDLMPADIVGTTNILVHRRGRVASRSGSSPGPIFANIVLADEINRATPKTQSALLEAMQEHRVTVGGTTYTLEQPFFVLGTQNPIEMEGTYPLPEAQVDRFLFKLEVGYLDEKKSCCRSSTGRRRPRCPRSTRCCTGEEILGCATWSARSSVAEHVKRYAVRSSARRTPEAASRPRTSNRYLKLGSSPRGIQA